MISKLHFIFFVISVCISNTSSAFTKQVGKGYCSIRHPVEAITSNRTACESQHIIQQQSSGADGNNTIWINTTQHDYLDRSIDQPWGKERP
ncbi:hypothetical protein [Psychromonas ingrahamii]|uniref:hypothetical protein n=1 Tax=Psychromonas ingrahamii TaxID=357794 RepID=UPI0012ECDF05|nr:hypothetical protein [Psychromonas ingrahamii]